MRKVGLIALTVVLGVAGLSADQGTPIGDCTAVRIEGLITAIDADAMQIVVDEQVVQVTDATVIKMKGRAFAFEDLQVDMTVAACGFMDDEGVLVASRITVKYCGN